MNLKGFLCGVQGVRLHVARDLCSALDVAYDGRSLEEKVNAVYSCLKEYFSRDNAYNAPEE